MGLERYRPGRGEISSGGLHHGWSSMGNGSCHQGVAKNISAFAVQWLVFQPGHSRVQLTQLSILSLGWLIDMYLGNVNLC